MELILMTIAWLFGILLGLYFKLGIVLFVVLFVFLCVMRKKKKYLKVICNKRYMLLFFICFFLSYLQISYLENTFNKKYQNMQEEIQVVGTIISNPIEKEYKTVYTIKVESINGDKSYQNTNLLLNVKKEKMNYAYGNQIFFIGDWEDIATQRNEGGLNYKEYLKTKKIYGIITTETSQIQIKKENNINFMNKLANKVAIKIKEKANILLPPEEASVLVGILIGDKENLSEEVQEAFRKSNLSHMLAVSGAHVSYVVMGIGIAINKAKINKRAGKVITILLLLFFMLLTGQTPSVTRSCIMSIYMIIASLFHKRVSVFSSMSISMLFLLITNPYCIFDIGLQLSYGGTLGIVLLYTPLRKWWQREKKRKEKRRLQKVKVKIQEMLLITLSANMILIPIILYHFNTLSLTFLISNLLASPIMGVLVILGFITIIFSFLFAPIGRLLALPLQFFLKIFLQIATLTSNLPFSQIYLATPKLGIIFIYYFIILLLLFYQKIKEKPIKRNLEKKIFKQTKRITRKKIIAVLLIITTVSFLYKQIPKSLKIYFIDVGQGDSTLIVTPKEKSILIDGGGARDKESFDVGESILMPYLLDRGITKLDYVLISHFDSDHVRTEF